MYIRAVGRGDGGIVGTIGVEVGYCVGSVVGLSDGTIDGAFDGVSDGESDGFIDGDKVGSMVGLAVPSEHENVNVAWNAFGFPVSSIQNASKPDAVLMVN